MEHQVPSLNLVSAGILFGILQIVFLLYFFLSKRKNASHKVFGLFLIVLLWAQIEAFLNRSGMMAYFPHLLNTGAPLIFLLGPILLIHTKSQTGQWLSVRKQLWHLLPFTLYFGYSFFFYLQPAAFKYNAFVRSFQPGLEQIPVTVSFDTDPLNIQGLVVVELLCLHMMAYSTYAIYLLHKQKESRPDPWLVFVNGTLLAGAAVLFLSQGGIINGYRIFDSLLPDFSADLFPTVATYAVSFYVLKNGTTVKTSTPRYYKSQIASELKNSRAQRVREALEKEHLYLRREFSLQLLAEHCRMSTHHLSQVLNQEMGISFFQLTNEYRIKEAKRLLSASPEPPKMEQLAYQLGYGSKSTFFSAFKKQTGTTPSKYCQKAA